MKIYLDHIGIACENLEDSSGFWKLLGLMQGEDELVEDQGVTTRFFSTSHNDPKVPKIELLEPTSKDSIYHDCLVNRGQGVADMMFLVEDINVEVEKLVEKGANLLLSTNKYAVFDTRKEGNTLTRLLQR